jgi:tetratricopeptide (TPR) repeat protein
LACYDRVLQLQPEQAQGWHHRGNALLYGYHQPKTAIESYRHALQIDPQLAITWRNQGNALVELHHYQDAIDCYEHSLAISPNDEIAVQARTQAQQELGLTLQPPSTKPAHLDSAWTEVSDGSYALSHGSDYPARRLDYLAEADRPSEFQQSRPSSPSVPTTGGSLILEDESDCRLIQLVEDFYSIGRDLQNTLCLRSQFSSRFHAVIRRLKTETGEVIFEIQDGGLNGKPSTNGILINGKPITRAFLNHQDVIVFGPRAKAIFQST